MIITVVLEALKITAIILLGFEAEFARWWRRWWRHLKRIAGSSPNWSGASRAPTSAILLDILIGPNGRVHPKICDFFHFHTAAEGVKGFFYIYHAIYTLI
jgi:hypothetical protein